MALMISDKIREKLTYKHGVTEKEIQDCFINRESGFLVDTREDHQSDPPTQWFIAETNKGRSLKIAFVQRGSDIFIRTAYEPNTQEVAIYQKYAV